MVYGIFTAGQRTWGGPRADAGAADSEVTPQQAIEHAIETGDDLNVVPETFKPAMEVRRRRIRPSALQPSSSVEGRFAIVEPGPSRPWEKEEALPSPAASDTEMGTHLRRYEHSSLDMSDSEGISVHTPQRVTSISGEQYGMGMQGDGVDEHDLTDSRSAWSRRSSRESYLSRRTSRHGSYPPSAYPTGTQSRAMYGYGGSKARSSSFGSADPRELSRHLGDIAAQQGMDDRRTPAEHRSPLGRISPLTAITVEDDFPGLHVGHGEVDAHRNEAEDRERKATNKERRQTRSNAVSNMV